MNFDAVRRNSATSEGTLYVETSEKPPSSHERSGAKASNRVNLDERMKGRKRSREVDEDGLAPSKKVQVDLTLSPTPADPAQRLGLENLRTSRSVARDSSKSAADYYRSSSIRTRRVDREYARQHARSSCTKVPCAETRQALEELESKMNTWMENIERIFMERMDQFENNIIQPTLDHLSRGSSPAQPFSTFHGLIIDDDDRNSYSTYDGYNSTFSHHVRFGSSTISTSNSARGDMHEGDTGLNEFDNFYRHIGGFDGNLSDTTEICNYGYGNPSGNFQKAVSEFNSTHNCLSNHHIPAVAERDNEQNNYDNSVIYESVDGDGEIGIMNHVSDTEYADFMRHCNAMNNDSEEDAYEGVYMEQETPDVVERSPTLDTSPVIQTPPFPAVAGTATY